MVARDGGCRWPGCDRPPGWTEAHHLREVFTENGPTDLNEMVLRMFHPSRPPPPQRLDIHRHRRRPLPTTTRRHPDPRTTTRTDLRHTTTTRNWSTREQVAWSWTSPGQSERYFSSSPSTTVTSTGWPSSISCNGVVGRPEPCGGWAYLRRCDDCAGAAGTSRRRRSAHPSPRTTRRCRAQAALTATIAITAFARPVDLANRSDTAARVVGKCDGDALAASGDRRASRTSTVQQPTRLCWGVVSDLKQILPADIESTCPVARVAAVVEHAAIATTATRTGECRTAPLRDGCQGISSHAVQHALIAGGNRPGGSYCGSFTTASPRRSMSSRSQ